MPAETANVARTEIEKERGRGHIGLSLLTPLGFFGFVLVPV